VAPSHWLRGQPVASGLPEARRAPDLEVWTSLMSRFGSRMLCDICLRSLMFRSYSSGSSRFPDTALPPPKISF
jgi:hypothetical protein